jgi:hypothetical protein
LDIVGSFPGLLWPGHEVDPLMPRLRMSGVISPLTLYTFLESTGRNVSLAYFLGHFLIAVKKLGSKYVNFLIVILFS